MKNHTNLYGVEIVRTFREDMILMVNLTFRIYPNKLSTSARYSILSYFQIPFDLIVRHAQAELVPFVPLGTDKCFVR